MIKCDAKLWNESQNVLSKEMGHVEKGQNRGRCEVYQKSVNIPIGSPYCYALQYWTFSVLDTLRNPLKKTGLVYSGFIHLKKTAQISKEKMQVGDLIFWKMSGKINGHIGRIRKVLRAGWCLSDEGNTSSGSTGSQREGGGNFTRKRNLSYPLGRMNVLGIVGIK